MVLRDESAHRDGDAIGEVIERASPECLVHNIGDAPHKTWQMLARHGRFPATCSNVKQYMDWAGGVDNQLGQFLRSQGHISEPDVVAESDKAGLALSLVHARHVLSAELRATLVGDLHLMNYLEPDDVASEPGELFASLVEHDVLEDNDATYLRLTATDWPSRERYIEKSRSFTKYMTPALVDGDVKDLLRSEKVASAVKQVVIEQAADYVATSGQEGLREMARYSIRHGLPLPFEVVKALPGTSTTVRETFVLLAPLLPVVGDEQLFDLLKTLGGEYGDLTFVGKDRPKVAFSPETVQVLEALKDRGVVNSYAIDGENIRVNKKHKPEADGQGE